MKANPKLSSKKAQNDSSTDTVLLSNINNNISYYNDELYCKEEPIRKLVGNVTEIKKSRISKMLSPPSENTNNAIRTTNTATLSLVTSNSQSKNPTPTISSKKLQANPSLLKSKIASTSLLSKAGENNSIKNTKRISCKSAISRDETTPSKNLQDKKQFTQKPINPERITKIQSKPFSLIITGLNSNELFSFYSCNKSIKSKMIDFIMINSKLILSEFKSCYRKMLKLESTKVEISKVGAGLNKSQPKTSKSNLYHLDINLVLVFELIGAANISNNQVNMDSTVAIGYSSKYYCDKESYKNNFRFEVLSKGPLIFWAMKEYTNVSYVIKNPL